MKLYMFYVGGDLGNSNIELHDVRLSVGKTPEDCRDDRRQPCWGEPKSLPLDCCAGYQADVYDTALTRETVVAQGRKVFSVNLSGYDPQEFGGFHRNILLIALDVRAAARKAFSQIEAWTLPHKDNVFELKKPPTSLQRWIVTDKR